MKFQPRQQIEAVFYDGTNKAEVLAFINLPEVARDAKNNDIVFDNNGVQVWVSQNGYITKENGDILTHPKEWFELNWQKANADTTETNNLLAIIQDLTRRIEKCEQSGSAATSLNITGDPELIKLFLNK